MPARMSAVLSDPDFVAFIDRHRLASKLTALHWQRVAVGCGAAAAVVGYNLWHRRYDQGAAHLVAWAAGLYLAGALVALVWRQRRLLAELHRPHPGARAQALAVADFVNARGATLLAVAAVGHALFLLASYLQVGFTGPLSGAALAALLLPTLGLLAHGLAQVPGDRLLVALHHRHARSDEAAQGGA